MRIVIVILFLVLGSLSCTQKSNQNKLPANNYSSDSLKIDSLSELISNKPTNGSYYAERSTLYLKLGKMEDAIKDLIFANSLDSLNPDYYVRLAEFYLRLGKSEIVNEVLQRGNRLIPNDKNILYNLGKLHFFIRDYKQALGYLNQAIKLDNYFAEAYFTRGLVYSESGNSKLAIENMQIATNRNPDYYDAYIQLGLMFAQKGDSLALQYYDNALNLLPDSYDAWYGKAMFYQENDNIDKAMELYTAMLDNISRDLPEIHFNMGYIQMMHYEDYLTAIQQFDTALVQYPLYIDAIYNQGYCYEALGNTNQAIQMYQKAVDNHPDYQLAIEGLQRLKK